MAGDEPTAIRAGRTAGHGARCVRPPGGPWRRSAAAWRCMCRTS